MTSSKPAVKRKYTSITIPTRLYENLEERVKGTGFSSVSDYVTYILRDTLADMSAARQKGSKEASNTVVEKLKALGYME